MNRVVEILMRRDSLSQSEAELLVQETIEEILDDPQDATEIIEENLGLEPDYIEDLIGYFI